MRAFLAGNEREINASGLVDPGYPAGDAGDDIAGDGFCAVGEFLPGYVGPHDFGHIAGLYLGHVAYIHHNLIHGHAAQHRAVLAVHVDTGTGVGEVVQVAIAEAEADGGYAGGGAGDIGVIVRNAVVTGQGAQQSDAAVEGEGIAQLAVVRRGHRGVAVENASQAHHVGAGGFVVEYGGAAAEVAVGDVQVSAQFLYCIFIAPNLAVGEGDIFRCGREVGVDTLDVEILEVCQAGAYFCYGVRQQSGATHAGIHVDMQVYFLVVQLAQGIVVLSLFQAGESYAPAILHHHFPFCREAGAQDKRTGSHAGGLHSGGLRRGGDTEKLQVAVIQCFDYTLNAVAVCFSFDDGHLFVVGQYLAHYGQIMTHGIGIDFGPGAEERSILHALILCLLMRNCNLYFRPSYAKKTMQTGIWLEIAFDFSYTARVNMPVIISTADPLNSMGWGLMELFEKGGPLMWALLFLSVVAFMVMFVCLWTTRASAVLPTRMVMSVESCIRRKDYAGLMSMCERDVSSFARTMHVIVMFLQRNPRANIDVVREVASAEGARQTNILTRQINWLSDIGAIAPMIGLLGTVVGMMKTFMEMAAGNFEGVKQMQMAHGIAEAMITTAGGLVLAIPAMAAYVFFRSRIQKRIADMEVAVTHILSVIAVQKHDERHRSSNYQSGTMQEVRREQDYINLPGDFS